jgi:predicted dehydrogenase
VRAPARIALAGCGRIAERGYLPAFRRAAGVELRAVADPDPARREQVAASLPGYASVAELLEHEQVEALVLATPVEGRLADARLAAERGVLALVEKPPAADLAEARALAALRPAPRMAFNRRFEPELQRMRAAIPAREERLELSLELDYRRDGWAPHVVRDDALADIGTHLIDLALWFSRGGARRVRAHSLTATTARVELELERGRARLATDTDRPFRRRFSVHAAGSGRRLAGHRAGGPAANVIGRLRGSRSALLADSIARELEALGTLVHGGEPGALAGAEDAVAVMAVVDGARRSFGAGGGWVDVE